MAAEGTPTGMERAGVESGTVVVGHHEFALSIRAHRGGVALRAEGAEDGDIFEATYDEAALQRMNFLDPSPPKVAAFLQDVLFGRHEEEEETLGVMKQAGFRPRPRVSSSATRKELIAGELDLAAEARVELPGADLPAARRDAYSVMFWVKAPPANGAWRSIVHWGDANGTRCPALWLHPHGLTMHARCGHGQGNNQGNDVALEPHGVRAGDWFHYALVVDKRKVAHFVNGELAQEGELAAPATVIPAHPLHIPDPWYKWTTNNRGMALQQLVWYDGPVSEDVIREEAREELCRGSAALQATYEDGDAMVLKLALRSRWCDRAWALALQPKPGNELRKLRRQVAALKTAVGGAAPKGAVVLWAGRPRDVPPGWRVCDGARGTPDLRGHGAKGLVYMVRV